jgi:hypothetical protein
MQIAILFILTFLVAYVIGGTDLYGSKLGLLLPVLEPSASPPVSSYASSYPFYSPSPFSSPSFSFSPPAALALAPAAAAAAAPAPTLRPSYDQLGFLTKSEMDKHPIILPLMGRRINRYKMQYYTISNSGFVNTELIIRKSEADRKSFRNEYGVDELFSDDTVFVDGYNEVFRVTLYDK